MQRKLLNPTHETPHPKPLQPVSLSMRTKAPPAEHHAKPKRQTAPTWKGDMQNFNFLLTTLGISSPLSR